MSVSQLMSPPSGVRLYRSGRRPLFRFPVILVGVVLLLLLQPVSAIDLDGDGMSDVWELIYGAQGLTASADTDGDGFSNLKESRAGTNPFDSYSFPGLSAQFAAPDSLSLSWPSAAGKWYD